MGKERGDPRDPDTEGDGARHYYRGILLYNARTCGINCKLRILGDSASRMSVETGRQRQGLDGGGCKNYTD